MDRASYLASITRPVRRRDAETLLALMGRVTGLAPHLYGPSMVAFGSYHYRYATGREGDAPAAAFAARTAAMTIYLADGVDAHRDQLARLGPHTTGKGCLYVKDLSRVDLDVLEEIVRESFTTASADGFGDSRST